MNNGYDIEHLNSIKYSINALNNIYEVEQINKKKYAVSSGGSIYAIMRINSRVYSVIIVKKPNYEDITPPANPIPRG